MGFQQKKQNRHSTSLTDKELNEEFKKKKQKADQTYEYFLNAFLHGDCDREGLANSMQRCNDLEMAELKKSDKTQDYIKLEESVRNDPDWFGEYEYYARATGWQQ